MGIEEIQNWLPEGPNILPFMSLRELFVYALALLFGLLFLSGVVDFGWGIGLKVVAGEDTNKDARARYRFKQSAWKILVAFFAFAVLGIIVNILAGAQQALN